MDCFPILTGSRQKPWPPGSASRLGARALAAALLCLVTAIATGADLLPPEQAFRYSARVLNDKTLEARFVVADGYYLYRDKFRFAVTPDTAAVGAPELPAGKIKTDEF